MEGAHAVLPERIEGDGVLLRRWLVSDAEALGRALEESDEHLRPWMAWMANEPLTLEQRRAMLGERAHEWLEGGDVMLGIFVAEQVAGSCGLHRRRGPCALEIGYWIHPAFTGRGLATQVVRILTDTALSLDGITHVEIHIDKANTASLGIPRRLGFRFLGEFPDEVSAPSELGIDCAWQVGRDEWQRERRDG